MRNPSTVANAWVRGMQQATAKMKEGVEQVTTAPGAKAADAAQLYLQKVTEAVSSQRFQNATRAVTLDQWRAAYIGKGLARVGSGASAAQDKMTKFMTWLLPRTDAVKQAIASMPKGTLEDSKARSARAIEMMAASKYKGTM